MYIITWGEAMSEIDIKLERIRALLEKHGLQALFLNRVSSFAWVTCGAASYVNTASTTGAASLLVTPQGRYVLTNNIEATRLEKEEKLAEQGWEMRIAPWHAAQDEVNTLAGGLKLGADGAYPGAIDLSGEIARLRADLLPDEGARFRMLGQQCAEIMDTAIRAVRPGMTEYQIAALLANEAQGRGVQPIVNLIATDERIFSFRHPLPVDKKMERYAMLVLCGRRWGLVASITRLIHFGRVPEEIRRKALAVAQVDAAMILATQPGRTLGEIFAQTEAAYAESGFPGEWKLHHQGGPAGYEPREFVATPGATEQVLVGQAYAWNPSITGAKSEDTILVGEHGNEILTQISGWPTYTAQLKGQAFERPAILEVE
jgi:antitoxin VapB